MRDELVYVLEYRPAARQLTAFTQRATKRYLVPAYQARMLMYFRLAFGFSSFRPMEKALGSDVYQEIRLRSSRCSTMIKRHQMTHREDAPGGHGCSRFSFAVQ